MCWNNPVTALIFLPTQHFPLFSSYEDTTERSSAQGLETVIVFFSPFAVSAESAER